MSTNEEAVRSYFEPFKTIDPRRYDPVLLDINAAIVALEDDDMGKISDVKDSVQDWRGNAADVFNEERLSTFGPILSRQRKVLAELALAATASREIATQAQKDIITIVMGCEASLEQLKKDCGGCSKAELTKALGIIAAIVGAIGGFTAILGAVGAGATAGTIAANAGIAGARIGAASSSTLGLLSAVGGAANNFRSDPEQIALKGDNVEEILESARDSVEKLNKALDDQEKKVKDTLNKDVELLTDKNLQIKDLDFPICDFEPPVV